jgi:hypothetical protein
VAEAETEAVELGEALELRHPVVLSEGLPEALRVQELLRVQLPDAEGCPEALGEEDTEVASEEEAELLCSVVTEGVEERLAEGEELPEVLKLTEVL